jgi:hypothetical protein
MLTRLHLSALMIFPLDCGSGLSKSFLVKRGVKKGLLFLVHFSPRGGKIKEEELLENVFALLALQFKYQLIR